jgi:glycosyltransferase involved in cell wall biosynthesis
MELVSVIIPVYNGEKTICRCVDSVLSQTWTNIEIIIVNDGSTDGTCDILASKYSNDNRIQFISQNQSGSPVARNKGIKNAKGNYFQFLDSDDYLCNNKIKNQIELAGSDKSVLVWCSTKKNSINQETNYKIIDKKELYNINDPLSFLLCLNGIDGNISMIQPNAFLVSKELLNKAGNWNESLRYSPDDDSEFFSRVILSSKKILFDNNSFNYYSAQKNSLSGKFDSLSASGALKTLKLKFDNILLIENSLSVRMLYRKHLSIVSYLYGPYNSEVLIESLNIIRSLGFKTYASVGGFYFRFIAYFTSFNTALKLRYFFRRSNENQ